MWVRSHKAYLILLTILAFSLRLAWAAYETDGSFTAPQGDMSNDDVQFDHLAKNLAAGEGYRVTLDRPLTSFRAPGFPFFLAGIYVMVGAEPFAAYLAFCTLGAAGCVLTYFLAREVLNETGARVAGLLTALYLPSIHMASKFISENLYIPCLALGLLLFSHYVRRRSHLCLGFAGLVLGYATLTRPATLLLLPLLWLVIGWSDFRERRIRLTSYGVFAATFLAVLLPWAIRNHQVHGHWILIATNGGTTFWGGNNDRVLNEKKSLGYWVPTTTLPERDQVNAAKSEYERDAIEWRLGKHWVREHWSSMPLLWVYKLARVGWLPDYGEGRRWLRIVSYVPFALLFAAFLLRCSWRKDYWTHGWQVLHASTLALIVTVLIFCGEPRYRDANIPVLMIYAVLGMIPSWRRAEQPPAA